VRESQWRGCGTTSPARIRLHALLVKPVALTSTASFRSFSFGTTALRKTCGSLTAPSQARFAATTSIIAWRRLAPAAGLRRASTSGATRPVYSRTTTRRALRIRRGRLWPPKVAVRGGRDYCEAGGIRNSGSLTLDQSVVANNGSPSAGGGIGNDGTLTIGRSTISANLGETTGGIFNDDKGQLIMRNSTLSANRAEFYASGLYNSGSAILNNVTISKNGETDLLDIPAVGTFGSGVTEISNTIIGGNIGPNCAGTLTSHGYNLIGGTAGCTLVGDGTGNIIGVAPKLGPLQDNGGPTPTHALLAGSPARNAGNPATPGSSTIACPTGDQRLLPRGTTRCDVGAVEMQ